MKQMKFDCYTRLLSGGSKMKLGLVREPFQNGLELRVSSHLYSEVHVCVA